MDYKQIQISGLLRCTRNDVLRFRRAMLHAIDDALSGQKRLKAFNSLAQGDALWNDSKEIKFYGVIGGELRIKKPQNKCIF